MGLLDISIRFKLPIWGGMLILISALTGGTTLMVRAYNDVRQDVAASADSLGRTMAKTLVPVLLHDDVWRAYEIIAAPLHGATVQSGNPAQADTILLLDLQNRIVVSSRPRELPMLADVAQIGPEYKALLQKIDSAHNAPPELFPLDDSDKLFFVLPVVDEDVRLGNLVLVYSNTRILNRFLDAVRSAAQIGAVVVLILLWLSWYWGRRMAVPLVTLAQGIRGLGRDVSTAPIPHVYPHKDELGELFDAFSRVLTDLRAKAALEKEMLKSERLAAVGRLAAGIAHEVNNPLAGLLTALDTLKTHGAADERTRRTMALLERGLQQIRDTVAALLVEGRIKSRDLGPQDIDDVQTLLVPQARAKGLAVEWQSELPASVGLPASPVRQVLINLMVNALHAANPHGKCGCTLDFDGNLLHIRTFNDGELLSPEQLDTLFEPFIAGRSESGHGLGLWVSYQIIRQLGGNIRHRADKGLTWFEVEIPVGTAT